MYVYIYIYIYIHIILLRRTIRKLVSLKASNYLVLDAPRSSSVVNPRYPRDEQHHERVREV